MKFRTQRLLEKYLNNESSSAELEELFDTLDAKSDVAYQEIMAELWDNMPTDKKLDKKKADWLFDGAIQTSDRDKKKSISFFRYYKVAAAILVLAVAFGTVYLLFGEKGEVQKQELADYTNQKIKSDISPGTTKAILQAGNKKIMLNKQDTTFMLAGNKVDANNGHLKIAEVKSTQYTLVVPRGGKYSLVLADGTTVWLNAASKLIYPSVFNKNSRDVTLIGEAYFKVSRDETRPFVVHTQKQDVKVLGTAFNIYAYPDVNTCITTLVQGKVQVSSYDKKMVLRKGQQAVSQSGQISLRQDADINQVLAWKEGYFRFYNMNIHDIMRQLSRWYDIDVKYDEDLKPHEFMAIISRDNNLSEVLNLLEETGVVAFKTNGREVVVLPPSSSSDKKK